MTGADANILVQLAFSQHPAFSQTTVLIDAELARGVQVMVPASVVTEFLHVITDTRRFTPALTMDAAIDWLDQMFARRVVHLLESSPDSLRLTLEWMKRYRLGRKRILDTHLAAVLHRAGVNRLITSNPDDFKVFGVFEIVTP
jgi:predicted nucleic acid-binding protein